MVVNCSKNYYYLNLFIDQKCTGTNKNELFIYNNGTFRFSDFNKCVDENNNKLCRQRLIK